jgi:ATP-dependent DNA helicase RecG
LEAPIQALTGPATTERLRRLGVLRVQDLLLHLPIRYEDRTRLTALADLRPGQPALVDGQVEYAEPGRGRRRSLVVGLRDASGTIGLRFFHFHPGQVARLAGGPRLRCYGAVSRGPLGIEMVHPECAFPGADPDPPLADTLCPVYPSTEGLSQRAIRQLVDRAFGLLPAGGALELPAGLPAGLPGFVEAITALHRPTPEVSVEALAEASHPARRRLAFEELLAYHLSLRRLRGRILARESAALCGEGGLKARFLSALPFALTAAQNRVIAEIETDLAQTTPMLRLLQGDVGSGKTVVAACAALRAIASGHQAAVMAPTELLAEQHLGDFRRWFEPLGIGVGSLGSGRTRSERRAVLSAMAIGHLPLVIGTHALFQEGVGFHRLGLAIVDEQHRFGVEQRLALGDKGPAGMRPHQLIMTATPIPRTLAMTAYADLDVSRIDELPPGRPPITTVVVPDGRRGELIARIAHACAEGRQVYWVCTVIEESETLACQAATDTAAMLAAELPGVEIGLVHGRVQAEERDRIMEAFRAGVIALLVATTVIEVGVDVPNASLMIIENAERLGLSQLHQLRGRVGRGRRASDCVLLYHAPLTALARARLDAIRATRDGFEIARRDLELRGPGEILGTRQAGLERLRVADPGRDGDLLPAVEAAGRALLGQHPECADALIRRWLGDALHYG